MGSGLLLSLVALPLLVLAGNSGGETLPDLAGALLLLLVVWSMIVLSHIVRHTFTIPLSLALGLSILYTFFSYAVMANIFQVT